MYPLIRIHHNLTGFVIQNSESQAPISNDPLSPPSPRGGEGKGEGENYNFCHLFEIIWDWACLREVPPCGTKAGALYWVLVVSSPRSHP